MRGQAPVLVRALFQASNGTQAATTVAEAAALYRGTGHAHIVAADERHHYVLSWA